MITTILLTITHTKPIADLTDKVAGRAFTLDGVSDVEAKIHGWQPIASAPKDGSEIMVCEAGTANIEFVRWYDGVASPSAWLDRGAEDFDKATHWQPNPVAP